jgi:hypothetical protein
MFSQFVAKYIIGIGSTAAYFTLRETYLNGGHISSYHIQNLSQDADAAYEKALSFSHNNGYELITTRDQMIAEMRDIQRTGAAMIAERAERMAKDEAAREAYIAGEFARKIDLIASGVFPLGQYCGKSFRSSDVPLSYIQWIVNGSFEPDTIISFLQDAIKNDYSDLILPSPDLDLMIGTVKQRATFNVKVIRYAHYFTEYGITHVVTMVDKSGACMISKGAFNANVGDDLTIKATVKGHDRYKGQMQTIVQRVAIV